MTPMHSDNTKYYWVKDKNPIKNLRIQKSTIFLPPPPFLRFVIQHGRSDGHLCLPLEESKPTSQYKFPVRDLSRGPILGDSKEDLWQLYLANSLPNATETSFGLQSRHLWNPLWSFFSVMCLYSLFLRKFFPGLLNSDTTLPRALARPRAIPRSTKIRGTQCKRVEPQKTGKLIVNDGVPVSVTSPGSAVALNVRSNFYQGGVRQLSNVNSNAVDNDPSLV